MIKLENTESQPEDSDDIITIHVLSRYSRPSLPSTPAAKDQNHISFQAVAPAYLMT